MDFGFWILDFRLMLSVRGDYPVSRLGKKFGAWEHDRAKLNNLTCNDAAIYPTAMRDGDRTDIISCYLYYPDRNAQFYR